ncbi:MAG: hypothetical protein MUE41_00500 [Gemmatimonadaceae bacterium]|jgi:hypothetical protein|nr:hypothetical protein [Gemmatimonadaceae bacterium]
MASRLGARVARMALFGLVVGGVLAVPMVLAGEKRYREAGLLVLALGGFVVMWVDLPTRVRAGWRALRRRSVREAVAAPAAGVRIAPLAVTQGAPVRRYKPASRGKQATAIASLAARGRDAQSIARELRVPYDVVQFALARKAA